LSMCVKLDNPMRNILAERSHLDWPAPGSIALSQITVAQMVKTMPAVTRNRP